MSAQKENLVDTSEKRTPRPQMITTDDLIEFKSDLIDEIKKLLRQTGIQPVKQVLKSPDVRKLLHISRGTLQNMRINGTLPFTKIGNVIYYEYDDIQKMLKENRSHPNY
jgi:hypothetical protein